MDSITNLNYLWNSKLDRYKKFIFLGNDSRQRPLFGPGVYFLWNSEGLQYIGQSSFVWGRLESHSVIGRDGKRKGWFIGVVPVQDYRERLDLEAYCIEMFKPIRNNRKQNAISKYNEIAHLRSEGKTLQAIGNIFGVSRERIRQILNGE